MILVVSMWVKAGNTPGVGVGGYCHIWAIEARCKESQFYSLPFRQAVASPQVISTSPKTLFD